MGDPTCTPIQAVATPSNLRHDYDPSKIGRLRLKKATNKKTPKLAHAPRMGDDE